VETVYSSLHRFFVPAESFRHGELILHGGQAHQIHDVLHLRAGEVIAALDNSGAEYHVELTRVERKAVHGHIVEKVAVSREPRTHLVLYQSLLKGEKFEWVLQKGTEIGISEFVPIITSRAVSDSVSRPKGARWERILVEAAEQSGRGKIPLLHPVQRLDDALKQAAARGGLALIPWEQEHGADLRSMLSAAGTDSPISLFIGPEGGFEGDEIDGARAQGVRSITLGSRILRAETASLVAASAILFARGELDASVP
jgi:16S rRNA (uracil1498-N3)-methyltransferase